MVSTSTLQVFKECDKKAIHCSDAETSTVNTTWNSFQISENLALNVLI